MFQYRVGTYVAISKLDNIKFELWHGTNASNSKLKNYTGEVNFSHKQIPTMRLNGKTNNGGVSIVYHPFLFFRLIKHNPDVILTEGASSFITASIAFLYCKLFGKKIIWWSLGTLSARTFTGISNVAHKWIRYMERHCDAVFAYSTQAESYFESIGVRHEKIFKAINVINTDSKLKDICNFGPVVKDSGFNIVFVGAITQQKQLELLVDAIIELSKKYNDILLHIIGDGIYLDAIKQYVSINGGEGIIVFHGRITEGLNVMLQKFSVLVLPGLGGLAIVDGMLSSLPVISGRADGTELDLIANGINGFVTSTMTKGFLLDKLTYLYNNPNEVYRMGLNSFERITGMFSFEHYMSVFSDCLKYVMS